MGSCTLTAPPRGPGLTEPPLPPQQGNRRGLYPDALPGRPGGRRATHSVCPRQKDAMLCGATAQLTRIFSSRSAVRTKRSSGLTACAEGERTGGPSGRPEPRPLPAGLRPQPPGPPHRRPSPPAPVTPLSSCFAATSCPASHRVLVTCLSCRSRVCPPHPRLSLCSRAPGAPAGRTPRRRV